MILTSEPLLDIDTYNNNNQLFSTRFFLCTENLLNREPKAEVL